MTLPAQLQRLKSFLYRQGDVAVALSGGVDSMMLAFIVHSLLPASLMFHAASPAVPGQALQRIRRYASDYGWNLEVLDAGEMRDPDYLHNPVNRCYFCKRNLYSRIRAHTSLPIVSGTNLDDMSDYRPGLQAASENAVIHPFVECAIDKKGIRELAAYFRLDDLRELPASPCLSSRVVTGTPINSRLLMLIDAVEDRLKDELAGLKKNSALRCRVHGKQITIQLQAGMPDTRIMEGIQTLTGEVLQDFIDLDLNPQVSVEPYRQGSAFIQESSYEK